MIIPKNILNEKSIIPINFIYNFNLSIRDFPYLFLSIMGGIKLFYIDKRFIPIELILIYIISAYKYKNQHIEELIINNCKYMYEKTITSFKS